LRPVLNILLFALLFLPVISKAVVLVNPPLPYPQSSLNSILSTLYFAGADGGASGTLHSTAFVNTSAGYLVIDTNNNESMIYLNVSSTQAFSLTSSTQAIVVTLSTAQSAGDEIPLTGASVYNGTYPPVPCANSGSISCIQGNHNSGTSYLSAVYQTGQILTLSFALADLCATTGALIDPSDVTNICGTSTPPTQINTPQTATLTQPLYATFSVADTSISGCIGAVTATGPSSTCTASTSASPPPATVDSEAFTLAITDVPPTIASPSPANVENFYNPADSSILITADNYGPGTNGGATLQSFMIFADRALSGASLNVSSNTALPASEVSGTTGYTGTNLQVTGFVNSAANGSGGYTNGYNGSIYAMNSAGIFSLTSITTPFPIPAASPGSVANLASDGLIHAEAVNSVLTKSMCFIATAAFHDGDAPPVRMLRRFRDQVLSKFELGRKFISAYYHYSPPVAMWAWDKPVIRSIALHALAPVEFVAWAILKFTHAEEADSPQPYIDRIKKKLDEENPSPTPYESYTEKIKKTLAPTPIPGGEDYINRIKKTLPPQEDQSTGYSQKIKDQLPPEDDKDSPIAKVKEGRDHPPEPKKPPIDYAMSVKFGVSPGFTVTNTDPNATVKFANMYGGTWQPDLVLHYEKQLFHSENLGSFGLGTDLGISYAEGYGQYAYPFGSQYTTTSLSKFSFIQTPLTFNGTYRFNWFRIVRPYVGAGLGAMLYDEMRHDGLPDRRGYSFIYEAMLGLAFRIDGLDSNTARDGFLSTGIQHSYLYAEYLYMNTFNLSKVLFGRNGLYMGVLFEL